MKKIIHFAEAPEATPLRDHIEIAMMSICGIEIGYTNYKVIPEQFGWKLSATFIPFEEVMFDDVFWTTNPEGATCEKCKKMILQRTLESL